MKTYKALFATDVPHYGFHDIEAEDDQAAIATAEALHKANGVECYDPSWEYAACARIVHIEAPDGTIIVKDRALDGFFLRSGGEAARILCDCAEALLRDLETLMDRAADLHAAIDGVTDQFEDEMTALWTAMAVAGNTVKAARGQA